MGWHVKPDVSRSVLFLMLSCCAGITPAAPFAYIPDGGTAVSVIDTATDTVVATVRVGNSGSTTTGVAVNAAGTRVYVANDGYASADTTVSVIDTSTNRVVATVPVGTLPSSCYNPFGVAVNPAGTRVYVNCSATVSVIDTATNTVVARVPAVSGNLPRGAAVNSAGTRVYATSYDLYSTAVIDTATNRVVATVGVGLQGIGPFGVAVNPAGTRVYVTNAGSRNVSVIDTTTNSVVATVPVGLTPAGVAVNPAGTRVYVANSLDDTVSVINPATNAVVATVNLPTFSSPISVAVNPAGTRVYVANVGSGNVSVIDTSTNRVVATVEGVAVGSRSLGIFISPGAVSNPPLADCLFNWAERNYPSLFSPAVATSNALTPYYYRYYSQTNAYLGTSSADNHVYYLGPLSNYSILDVGALPVWSSTAGCQ